MDCLAEKSILSGRLRRPWACPDLISAGSKNGDQRKLEKEIENLEKSISIVNNKMLQEEFYSDYKKMNELQKELENLNASLEEKYLEWEEINSQE